MTEQKEYTVEAIVGKKIEFSELHYLVKWSGFAEAESTWEPYQNLAECIDMIMDFESMYRFPFSSKSVATQYDIADVEPRSTLNDLPAPVSEKSTSKGLATVVWGSAPLSVNGFRKLVPRLVQSTTSNQPARPAVPSAGPSRMSQVDFSPYQGKSSLVCQQCGLSFRSTLLLNKHMVVQHPTQTTYVCPICGEIFARNDAAAKHARRHVPEKTLLCQAESGIFHCPSCGKEKEHYFHLESHYQTCATKNGKADCPS